MVDPVSTDNLFFIHQNYDLTTSNKKMKAGIFGGRIRGCN